MVDWREIRHFTKKEFGPHVDRLDPDLIFMLDRMRHDEDVARRRAGQNGIIITINEAWAARPNNPFSQHPRGRAVDYVIRDAHTRRPLNIIEQYLIASKYPWGGLGFYPYWKAPGLHSDTRPRAMYEGRAEWWRDEQNQYRPVRDFFKYRLKIKGYS